MGDGTLRCWHVTGSIGPRIDYNARFRILPVLEELRSAIHRRRHNLANADFRLHIDEEVWQ